MVHWEKSRKRSAIQTLLKESTNLPKEQSVKKEMLKQVTKKKEQVHTRKENITNTDDIAAFTQSIQEIDVTTDQGKLVKVIAQLALSEREKKQLLSQLEQERNGRSMEQKSREELESEYGSLLSKYQRSISCLKLFKKWVKKSKNPQGTANTLKQMEEEIQKLRILLESKTFEKNINEVSLKERDANIDSNAIDRHDTEKVIRDDEDFVIKRSPSATSESSFEKLYNIEQYLEERAKIDRANLDDDSSDTSTIFPDEKLREDNLASLQAMIEEQKRKTRIPFDEPVPPKIKMVDSEELGPVQSVDRTKDQKTDQGEVPRKTEEEFKEQLKKELTLVIKEELRALKEELNHPSEEKPATPQRTLTAVYAIQTQTEEPQESERLITKTETSERLISKVQNIEKPVETLDDKLDKSLNRSFDYDVRSNRSFKDDRSEVDSILEILENSTQVNMDILSKMRHPQKSNHRRRAEYDRNHRKKSSVIEYDSDNSSMISSLPDIIQDLQKNTKSSKIFQKKTEDPKLNSSLDDALDKVIRQLNVL